VARINRWLTGTRHRPVCNSRLLEFVMRINGGVILLVIPIMAILLFGASLAWDRLEVIDPTFTGSIK
jgi:hypothetical protein